MTYPLPGERSSEVTLPCSEISPTFDSDLWKYHMHFYLETMDLSQFGMEQALSKILWYIYLVSQNRTLLSKWPLIIWLLLTNQITVRRNTISTIVAKHWLTHFLYTLLLCSEDFSWQRNSLGIQVRLFVWAVSTGILISCLFSCATVKGRNDILANGMWSETGKHSPWGAIVNHSWTISTAQTWLLKHHTVEFKRLLTL